MSERLYLLVVRLEGLGVLRSADDVRVVADDLRDTADDGLRSEDVRVRFAIERLTMICARLARGGLVRFADDLGRLVDDLRHLRESPPSP